MFNIRFMFFKPNQENSCTVLSRTIHIHNYYINIFYFIFSQFGKQVFFF